MKTNKELKNAAEELYKKLGGPSNPDARLVRALWERLEKAEAEKETVLNSAREQEKIIAQVRQLVQL